MFLRNLVSVPSHPQSTRDRAVALVVGVGLALTLTLATGRAVDAAPSQQNDRGNSAAELAAPGDPLVGKVDAAVDAYADGDFGAADRLLTQLIAEGSVPDSVRTLVYFNRGAARLRLDRFQDAVDDFDAAERLQFPQPAQLHLARGLAWELLDRPDRAANDFVDALHADPRNPTVRAKIRSFFNKP